MSRLSYQFSNLFLFMGASLERRYISSATDG
jgi:hypothetical protein